jgi:CRISPR-associated protein Cmr1
MRWWYEAIVRGLGGDACDPSQHECIFDAEKYRKSKAIDERQRLRDAGLCDVCQVFGATGWRRRFRLEVVDKSKQLFQGNTALVPSGHIRVMRSGKRAGGWYIGPGRITLKGSSLEDTFLEFPLIMPSFEKQIIPSLMIIERWGGLGAKNQLGCGVIKINECVKNEWQPLQATAPHLIYNKIYKGNLPALNDFFFAKIRFKPNNVNWWKDFLEIKMAFQGEVQGVKLVNPITEAIAREWLDVGAFPIAPIIRNWLHFNLYLKQPPNSQNFLLGTAKQVCPTCYSNVRPDNRNPRNRWCGKCARSFPVRQIIERAASKIKISSAYELPNYDCWEFRIWGWFPQKAPNNISINRDKLLQMLYDAIKPAGELWSGPLKHLDHCDNAFEWHEFGAPKRDLRRYSDPAEFLEDLLEDADHDL